MKKTILLALICAGIFACSKKENASPQPEIQSASVPYRKATTVSTAGENLTLELRGVVDSRCPKDVVCIQMGDARLTFNISDGGDQKEVKATFKGDKRTDFQEFTLSGVNYVLRVNDVSPYPVTTQAPKLEDYKVDLTIEKK